MKYSLRSLMPKRSWFQFSLKTMLVAMTLICLGPGGYVSYHQGKAREQIAALKTVNQNGGYFGDLGFNQESRSPLARVILGDDHAARFTLVHFFQSLPDGRTFTFQNDCLRHLAKLPKIKDVDLSDIAVSDAGLVHLARLKNLKTLSLKNTKVTDAGVAQLQEELPDCRITR
jgi:hypothetical protein